MVRGEQAVDSPQVPSQHRDTALGIHFHVISPGSACSLTAHEAYFQQLCISFISASLKAVMSWFFLLHLHPLILTDPDLYRPLFFFTGSPLAKCVRKWS